MTTAAIGSILRMATENDGLVVESTVKQMGDIIVTAKQYELPDEGLHESEITEIEDMGVVETQHGPQEKLKIRFTMLDQNGKDGKPLSSLVFVTKKLGPKANLSKLIAQLGITPKSPFNVSEIVGLKPQVVIVHAKSKDGTRTFANIDSIVPKRKSAPKTNSDEL